MFEYHPSASLISDNLRGDPAFSQQQREDRLFPELQRRLYNQQSTPKTAFKADSRPDFPPLLFIHNTLLWFDHVAIQIFDYGNTDIEKRAVFCRRLLPLLEFGREREGIDLSKVVLTHHNLKNKGRRPMPLYAGPVPQLDPITEAGSGELRDKEKAYRVEIIEKVNDLFQGELTDQDKLVYVNNVIKGKLLESKTLRQQAANNTKEQFANSPDLLRKPRDRTQISAAAQAHRLRCSLGPRPLRASSRVRASPLHP
ncbi:MAG: hypothetical protein ACKVP0_28445, partial [Pirellulaceae bacterium]